MYEYRVLTATQLDITDDCDAVVDACNLTEIDMVSREPSDDSNDPGGIVSLSQLGYKTLARHVRRDEMSRYLSHCDYQYFVSFYTRASSWTQRLQHMLEPYRESYVVCALTVCVGRHTPYSEDEMYQLKTERGPEAQAYESMCSVELCFGGYAPEDVFRP